MNPGHLGVVLGSLGTFDRAAMTLASHQLGSVGLDFDDLELVLFG